VAPLLSLLLVILILQHVLNVTVFKRTKISCFLRSRFFRLRDLDLVQERKKDDIETRMQFAILLILAVVGLAAAFGT
jgi:hypothetical protein